MTVVIANKDEEPESAQAIAACLRLLRSDHHGEPDGWDLPQLDIWQVCGHRPGANGSGDRMIRPEIEALIKRGHVQIDEFSGLDCSQEEATALIPALTNFSLAMRLSRVIANTPKWEPWMPGFRLRSLAQESKLRLEGVPGHLPQYSNQELAQHIAAILHADIDYCNPQLTYPQPGTPDCKGYIEALYLLSDQARLRLKGGF